MWRMMALSSTCLKLLVHFSFSHSLGPGLFGQPFPSGWLFYLWYLLALQSQHRILWSASITIYNLFSQAAISFSLTLELLTTLLGQYFSTFQRGSTFYRSSFWVETNLELSFFCLEEFIENNILDIIDRKKMLTNVPQLVIWQGFHGFIKSGCNFINASLEMNSGKKWHGCAERSSKSQEKVRYWFDLVLWTRYS